MSVPISIMSPFSPDEVVARIQKALKPLPPGWPHNSSLGADREIRARVTGNRLDPCSGWPAEPERDPHKWREQE